MSFTTKIVLFSLAFAAVSLASFALWGDWFEAQLKQDEMQKWISEAQSYAWIIAIALLVGDLILPIPATPIMAALGIVYGPLLGGLIAAAGSTLAALCGYGIARWAGKNLLRRIASEDELARFHHFYDNWGGATIILSRSLPVLPEIMSVLAGLAKMHIGRFLVAVLLGAVPTGIFMAWVGHAARESTATALVAVTIAPVLLWPVYLVILRHFTPPPVEVNHE